MLIHVNISILIPVCEWLVQKPVRLSKNVVYQFLTRMKLTATSMHITVKSESFSSFYQIYITSSIVMKGNDIEGSFFWKKYWYTTFYEEKTLHDKIDL